jgi:Tfp pilus assembly protein FimT
MKKGFTIAEVLIVVSFIVLMAMISIPVFRTSQKNTELKSETKILVADLRLAQQNTVGEQKTYLIKLISSPVSYQLIKRDGGDTIIKDRPLLSGITWQDKGGFTGDEIIFLSNGAVAEAGTVVLQNASSQTNSVEIKPSGYVRSVE